jgi:hypothetical protein
MYSNLSFKVGDEVVFVLHKLLTSRSEYFRKMLEGSFPVSGSLMKVEYEIPIFGIEADVFKMIIEWIYSMEIKQLGGMSPSLLYDLERLYIAADMYQITDLCDSIVKYLESLVNEETFGDICQIAKKIGSESLEKAVLHSWIAKSDSFNANRNQISGLIFGNRADCVEASATRTKNVEETGLGVVIKLEEGIKIEDWSKVKDAAEREKDISNEAIENEKIVAISHKIIRASEWDGETGSKTCVITCLTSLLSVKDELTKKRKIAIEI